MAGRPVWCLSVLVALATLFMSSAALAESDSWFDEDAATQAAPREAEPQQTERPRAPAPKPQAEATRSERDAEGEIDYEDADPRALEEFVPRLKPYGVWVEHPHYGLVWVPERRYVGSEFRPYVTSGYWALDDAGEWVWVSDLPFGDVVFHYGRWIWVDDHGWVWIPGRRYSTAWVDWRVPTTHYSYVGWVVMPPTFIWVHGRPVYFQHHHHHYYHRHRHYVYVPSRHVFSRHVNHYVVRDRYVARRLTANTRRVVADPRVRVTRSPTFGEARVPTGQRSMALSRRARYTAPTTLGTQATPSSRTVYSRREVASPSSSLTRPAPAVASPRATLGTSNQFEPRSRVYRQPAASPRRFTGPDYARRSGPRYTPSPPRFGSGSRPSLSHRPRRR